MSELTVRECFDLMAEAHMQRFGMKGSLLRETVWTCFDKLLDDAPSLIDEVVEKMRATPIPEGIGAQTAQEPI